MEKHAILSASSAKNVAELYGLGSTGKAIPKTRKRIRKRGAQQHTN